MVQKSLHSMIINMLTSFELYNMNVLYATCLPWLHRLCERRKNMQLWEGEWEEARAWVEL